MCVYMPEFCSVESEISLIKSDYEEYGMCGLVKCEAHCIRLQGQRVHHTSNQRQEKTIHKSIRLHGIISSNTFHNVIKPCDSQPTTA